MPSSSASRSLPESGNKRPHFESWHPSYSLQVARGKGYFANVSSRLNYLLGFLSLNASGDNQPYLRDNPGTIQPLKTEENGIGMTHGQLGGTIDPTVKGFRLKIHGFKFESSGWLVMA